MKQSLNWERLREKGWIIPIKWAERADWARVVRRNTKGQGLMQVDKGRYQTAEQGIRQSGGTRIQQVASAQCPEILEPGSATHRDWLRIWGS